MIEYLIQDITEYSLLTGIIEYHKENLVDYFIQRK
jgi:hypothetical protein